jgi:hypothetical protein
MTADMLIGGGDPPPRSGVDRTMREGTVSTQPRRAASSRARLLAVAAAALALLATACSGGPHPAGSRASSSPNLAATHLAAMNSYARCLRTHGLANAHVTFAPGGPNFSTVMIFDGLAIQGATPGTPRTRAAVHACYHLIPQGTR